MAIIHSPAGCPAKPRHPARCSALLRATAVLLVSLVGCLPTEPSIPAEIVISTPTLVLERLGEAAQLTARVLDRNGRDMAVPIEWFSGNPEVIEVDQAGLATARYPGRVMITVLADTLARSVEMSVDLGRTSIRVLSGSSVKTGSMTEMLTVEVENTGNPGLFIIQAWGLGTSLGSPNVMFTQTAPVEASVPWRQTLSWPVQTGRTGSQPSVTYLVVYSKPARSTGGYRETHRFDVARGVPLS